MASYGSRTSYQSPNSSPASLTTSTPCNRRSSTRSIASPTLAPTLTSPRVQLVPHARHPSYDAALSPSDLNLLAATSFSPKDISSKDFDFEDVFTYDKPQKKLKSVVEVSSPSRSSTNRDWSNFSFSHYPGAVGMRAKVNGRGNGSRAGEMYVRNQGDARKR